MARIVDGADRMTLDEFEQRLPEAIKKFVDDTRREQSEGAEGFVGFKYEHRTLVDWLDELAAYHTYHELSRIMEGQRAKDRRRGGGSVERRRLA